MAGEDKAMAGEKKATVGRRAVLAAAAGGAAALAAQAAGAILPGAARAADGSAVVIGQNNEGGTPTWVSSPATSPALGGNSTTGDGIEGLSGGAARSGVYGRNTNGAGYGVFGRNLANDKTGYLGGATAGASGACDATEGSLGTSNNGVDGRNLPYGTAGYLGGQGAGAEGSNDTGTAGALGVWNAGVWGRGTNTAPALKVDGTASFKYSGIAKVAKGRSSVRVTGLGFGVGPAVSGLAMLQAYRPGVAVAATVVSRSAGTVTIYLTKAVTAITPVAYYVFLSRPATL